MSIQEQMDRRLDTNWDSSKKGWQERRQAVQFGLGAVRAALNTLDLKPDDLVLVACSGGADSLALAALTAIAAQEIGKTTRKRGFSIRVGAVIVDHQLQPNSAEVAAATADLCRRELVQQLDGKGEARYLTLDPVIMIEVEVSGEGGPEAAAREARYNAIDRAVADTGAKAVLFGHTQDDQAEQVLLGLARGSGTRSLAGMPARNSIYLRPFLGVSRTQVERICAWFGLEPWQDPTNQQPIYLRNRIRLSVLPALHDAIGPGVSEALARTAEQLAEDAEALDAYAAELLVAASVEEVPLHRLETSGNSNLVSRRDSVPPQPATPTVLSVEGLLQAPTAVRRRALRMAALQAGAPASGITRAQVLAIDALVANWHGQSAHMLPGNVTVSRKHGMLVFHNPSVEEAAAPSSRNHGTTEA